MDYLGIINLVLVTLFFSTILAPHLKRVGEIKDEIADVDFPVLPSNEQDEVISKLVSKKGIELSKKLTQYEDKYCETRKFLKYFYWILGILAAIQILVIFLQGQLWSPASLLLVGSLIVIVVVVRLVQSYMIEPSVVRSVQWLADKGIAAVYTEQLLDPKLVLNRRLSNIELKNGKTTLSIRSSVDLNGYGYLLTIESENRQKLYAISMGFINGRLIKLDIAFPTGQTGSDIHLVNCKLSPGRYTAKLLFLSQVYSGNYVPGETTIDFEISRNLTTQPQIKKIHLEGNDDGYKFTVKNTNNKQKITHMEASQSFDGDRNIAFILSSKKLLKYLSKGHRPIGMYSKNGDIDRYDLERSVGLYNVFKRRLYRRIRHPKKGSKGILVLLNRSPKSKLD